MEFIRNWKIYIFWEPQVVQFKQLAETSDLFVAL